MSTLLLVRHGLTAMTGPRLAGWTPGVALDERGRAQARALADRLAAVPLTAVVSSPLDRCLQTAEQILAARRTAEPEIDGPEVDRAEVDRAEIDGLEVDERFGEVRYGEWTGRPLAELAGEPLWRVVQGHPSSVRFPGTNGESLAAAQHRAVTAVRDWNARLGPEATYLVCSHGDIIKSIVADALGLHLDQFQRIHADPASLTVIRYTELRPFLVRLNDTGGAVDDLVAPPRAAAAGDESDAPVGGGA